MPEAWLTLHDVDKLCRETGDLLDVTPGPWQLDDRWLGDRYSAETASGVEAVKQAVRNGLDLETCYTGKAMAAAMHDDGGPDLFWQTHNQIPLDALVASDSHLDDEIWRWDVRKLIDRRFLEGLLEFGRHRPIVDDYRLMEAVLIKSE